MAKCLVTGGTGFIGSHTVVELINAGHDVVIIDNLSNSDISVLDGIEKITGKRPDFENLDLRAEDSLKKFSEEHKGIDAIVHFAALKAVGESVEKPIEYYKNNIISLLNVVEYMRNEGIDNLIYSSSATVYGQAKEFPVDENSPLQDVDSPYGYTKLAAERIIRDVIRADNTKKAVVLRYFNPIGAHHSAFIGETPPGVPNNLVPYVMQTGAGVREELKVYGNDYDTPDGTGVRDYIHVMDLGRAHIGALERLLDNKQKENFEIFNVGTGRGVSVLEIIKTFEKISGQKLNYRIVDRRAGDIAIAYACTEKANKELGWEARESLEDALRSAWEWEKKRLGLNGAVSECPSQRRAGVFGIKL